MKAGIVPEVISVTKAVSETVAFLRDLDMANNSDVRRELRAELENSFATLHSARSRLRTACAMRNLAVIVVEPGSGDLRALPGEYFNRPSSASAFEKGKLDLSELEDGDPVYDFVAFADGRQCAFLALDFFEWLREPKIGAAVEPPLRPFFNMSALEPPSLQIAEEAEPPPERAAVAAEVLAIAPEAERVAPPVANEPKTPKARRPNAKQYKIAAALPTLASASDWADLSIPQRRHRVELHFNQKEGWCPERTFYRAWSDYQAAQAMSEGSATSAT